MEAAGKRDRHKVLILRCAEYDSGAISGIVRNGIELLGAKPSGKILVKPNTVLAHDEVFPHAFTRKEFLEGVLTAVRESGTAIEELAVGERSGITIPTRFNFKSAGYLDAIRKNQARAYYFDECRQVPLRLTTKGSLHKVIFVAKPVMDCDFFINLPKLKAHPWTRMTAALKNLIGIQDDRHRLIDHNSFLEHKIADLQEAIPPGLIAVDAIVAGQKMMLTPTPFHLGAIVMGLNACAVDTVCSHMIHLNPQNLVHLRLAAERGYGPCTLEEIEILGDFPLDEVREKTRGFEFCMERIDSYFAPSDNLSCTVGTFPEGCSSDYCWGGCPGALQEAMHIFRGYYPEVDSKMKKIRYVVGQVEGPLDLEPDERVIFAGDCTAWEGFLDGSKVTIRSTYSRNVQEEVTETKSNDMLLKLADAMWHCFRKRSSRYIHVKGCPVSVAQHVSYLSSLGKIGNPNFDPRMVLPVTYAYWQMRAHRLWNRFFG
ncbi:MAG: DUF362 domain-containing protein [Desulfobacteraceae bacterium]|nr:MAG: DUF362 domain-containing protein [Desulfobacteraceae bacterium]